jgi:hypothetical protein
VTDKPADAGPFVELGVSDLGEAEPIRIEMDKRVDLIVSLVVIAVGILIVYMASGFRVGSFPDPVTSRGLPYFTGTYLIIAGLILAARRVYTWQQIPGNYTMTEGHEDEPNHPASTVRAFTIMGLATLWAVLLKPVGFLIVTPFVLAAILWLMDVRSIRKLAAFSLGFTFFLWLAFTQVLGIVLPYGPLTALARSWGLIY